MVCNIMTQRGENRHFTDSDHVAVLHKHLGEKFIDTVLVNINQVPAATWTVTNLMNTLVQVEHDFKGLHSSSPSDFFWFLWSWSMEEPFMMVKSSRRVDADRAGEKMSFTVRVKEELLSLKRFEKRGIGYYQDVWEPRNINGRLDAIGNDRKCQDRSPYLWIVASFLWGQIGYPPPPKPIWKKSMSTQYSWMKRWKRFLLTYTWQMPFWDWDRHWCQCFRRWSSQSCLSSGSFSVEWFHQGSWKRKVPVGNSFCLYRPRGRNCPSHARIFTRCETIERKKEW